MTLADSTRAMLEAIETEDMNALAIALEARAHLLRQGVSGSPEGFEAALEAGTRALSQLERLKQRWAAEGARLQQLRLVIAREPSSPARVLHG